MFENLLHSSPYIFVPILIALIDFVTIVRSRFADAPMVGKTTSECHDFTLLIPIFGDLKYLRNVAFLKRYGERVVLCTTTKENPEFDAAIERVARENRFRIFRSTVPISSSRSKPNPWRLFTGTLHGQQERDDRTTIQHALGEEARDEIMRESSRMVDSEYSIFIDGDTVATERLELLTGLMREKKYDLASVRVIASRTESLIEKLQGVEYELAMDARKIYPWLTSGAAMIAKTAVIKDIMSHHSLFFSGGDIEIGKLAKMMEYTVGHIAFTFLTDVPETFRTWFRQRMAWFGGGFRHAVINMHQYTWRHPMFYFYTTFLVYLMTPVRWYEVVRYPLSLPIVIVMYWGLIFLFHFRRVRPFYILFPFYALFQVMVLVPLGMYTYFRMAFTSENSGVIKLRNW